MRLGRRVAIKFLHTQSEDLAKRFILEARTTAACSHENIVTIFEVDAWQGSPFMVFEYIHGQTLTKLIPEGKPLPPPRVVELMVPVVRALAFAHTQGIVHRDLKPDNVMVTDSGVTKVLDFGIAKVLLGDEKAPEYVARPRPPSSSMEDHSTAELTGQGAMMGTLAYMAPEQWGIGVPIDHRADIWSVGIMLFKMLAGKHPLEPLRGQQLMVTGMLNEPMPKLSTLAPDVPSLLAEAVDRCLLKHKDKRWPDAVSLLRALEPYLPGRYTRELKIDESPYAGLSSFQEADADKFFGRGMEVAALVNRLRERPIIGVVGPSGAGKSSFVRAGLVPALKRSGEPWEALVLRPGRSPLASLAGLIAPMVSTSASVADELAEEKKLTVRLAAEPGYVGSVLRARARREKKSMLVFVDQFEELYTQIQDPAERKAFTACLSGIADDATAPIRLVLSIRSDFLDRVSEDPRFMAELTQGLTFLTAPGRDGLRDAIVQPAEQAGYKFENPEIVDDMLKHLASTQGALPLLQFAAQQLWENRDPARKQLTRLAYEAIGGVAGALASHAEAVLARLNPAALPLVRTILLRLITPDRTRAIVSLDELRELNANPAEVQKLVDELVQARLLVVQTGSGAATVEIVHESLLHSWPTLRRWLEESGEDAAFLDQLRVAARQWTQNDQDHHLLWRGELAEEATRFQRRNRSEL
ncbi:MAG: ATPase, partial [Myxococcaceae bacterium]|nr:ATPase [Myxococcaceae bacterium]